MGKYVGIKGSKMCQNSCFVFITELHVCFAKKINTNAKNAKTAFFVNSFGPIFSAIFPMIPMHLSIFLLIIGPYHSVFHTIDPPPHKLLRLSMKFHHQFIDGKFSFIKGGDCYGDNNWLVTNFGI